MDEGTAESCAEECIVRRDEAMTDRERQLIEAYLPHPRDPELGIREYYALDQAGRVQRVEMTDILSHLDGEDELIVVQADTRRKVSGWMEFGGFPLSDLYDNKEDCRDRTHAGVAYWERLRRLEEEE